MSPATSIDELLGRYGDELIGIEEFAELVGVRAADLRMERRRHSEFPSPSEFAKRAPRYRLSDLLDWTVPRRAVNPQPAHVALWCLTRAAEACVRRHGPDPTRLFLAGAGLVQSNPVINTVVDDWDGSIGALRQALRDHVGKARPPTTKVTGRAPSFASDPDPASDWPRVLQPLLSGGSSEGRRLAIPNDSADAVRVMHAVSALWRLEGAHDPWSFADHLDRVLIRLGQVSMQVATRSSEAMMQLLVTLASPEPGEIVFDPACGEGGGLIAAAMSTRAKNGAQTIGLVGRDLDETAWLIAKARLGMRGLLHNLGSPGRDSLDPSSDDPDVVGNGFDCVISEPTGRLHDAFRWLARTEDWLGANGRAVIELPIKTLDSGRRESDVASGRVCAVVTTPARMRPEVTKSLAVWVLRRSWERGVLLIDLSKQGTRDAVRAPLGHEEIDAVGRLMTEHGAGKLRADRQETDGGVVYRPVNGAELARSADYSPMRWLSVEASPVVDEARQEALGLARKLQTLIETDMPDPDAGVPHELVGALHDAVTGETIRAIRRLVNSLSGHETRGRPGPPSA